MPQNKQWETLGEGGSIAGGTGREVLWCIIRSNDCSGRGKGVFLKPNNTQAYKRKGNHNKFQDESDDGDKGRGLGVNEIVRLMLQQFTHYSSHRVIIHYIDLVNHILLEAVPTPWFKQNKNVVTTPSVTFDWIAFKVLSILSKIVDIPQTKTSRKLTVLHFYICTCYKYDSLTNRSPILSLEKLTQRFGSLKIIREGSHIRRVSSGVVKP
uniref:Uncharacterized protein n=1 Tax=Oryza brachyantha TaxID=4533 RepID=J3M4F0_ORYBR